MPYIRTLMLKLPEALSEASGGQLSKSLRSRYWPLGWWVSKSGKMLDISEDGGNGDHMGFIYARDHPRAMSLSQIEVNTLRVAYSTGFSFDSKEVPNYSDESEANELEALVSSRSPEEWAGLWEKTLRSIASKWMRLLYVRSNQAVYAQIDRPSGDWHRALISSLSRMVDHGFKIRTVTVTDWFENPIWTNVSLDTALNSKGFRLHRRPLGESFNPKVGTGSRGTNLYAHDLALWIHRSGKRVWVRLGSTGTIDFHESCIIRNPSQFDLTQDEHLVYTAFWYGLIDQQSFDLKPKIEDLSWIKSLPWLGSDIRSKWSSRSSQEWRDLFIQARAKILDNWIRVTIYGDFLVADVPSTDQIWHDLLLDFIQSLIRAGRRIGWVTVNDQSGGDLVWHELDIYSVLNSKSFRKRRCFRESLDLKFREARSGFKSDRRGWLK